MRFKHILAVGLLFQVAVLHAQVPAVGSSKRIDVGAWNLYWFSDPSYGPSDDAAQVSAVAGVIAQARIDIWAFEEVADTQAFGVMMRATGYMDYRISDYWQDQKTALAWDSREWSLLSDSQLFQSYASDFASGRLPICAVLEGRKKPDTLIVVGLHLKAHTGNDAQKLQSWENRRKSCNHLKNWAEQHKGYSVILLGDWNDDIDHSLVADSASSILSMKEAGYFLTEPLSLLGENSWLYGNAMIDHIWVNDRMNARYQTGSCKRYLLDKYLVDYGNTVSDHYPVYAAFDYAADLMGVKEPASQMRVYPNPARSVFYVEGVERPEHLRLFDMHGKQLPLELISDGELFRISCPGPGVYLLIDAQNRLCVRLVVSP